MLEYICVNEQVQYYSVNLIMQMLANVVDLCSQEFTHLCVLSFAEYNLRKIS